MPIPGFNTGGLIPPFVGTDATTAERSPYIVTMSEFAATFGTSPHRRVLIRNLIAYRSLLATDGYESGIQFVDGSFVENVEVIQGRDPEDIDVFSLLSVPQKYLSDLAAWHENGFPFWQNEIVDQAKNKDRFSLDTYAMLYEEMQPISLIKNVIYWYGLFSHQRDTYAWKGFVAVVLNPAEDKAALVSMGAA